MDIWPPYFSNIEPQLIPTYILLLLYFGTCIKCISPKSSNAKHYELICIEKVAKMEHVVNRRIWGLLVHKATLYLKPPKVWRKLSATLKETSYKKCWSIVTGVERTKATGKLSIKSSLFRHHLSLKWSSVDLKTIVAKKKDQTWKTSSE